MIGRTRWPATGSAVAVGLALCAGAGVAATPSELERCARIDAPDARLRCYDAAMGRQPAPDDRAATTRPAAPAAAPPAARGTAEEPAPFGLPKPRPSEIPAQQSSIAAVITSVSIGRLGQAQVRLDNGQAWTVEGADSHLDVGDKVVIKRAALGSYLLTTSSRHSYRVQRTE